MTSEMSLAFVWRGDPNAPAATDRSSRVGPLFDAFDELGVAAEPVAYADEAAAEIGERLKRFDGVLVWVNPIEDGKDRSVLDEILRDVSGSGVFVSAHPDVILAMGTKEVLYATRDFGWGTDTHLHATLDDLRSQLPELLHTGPRVLKQYRGNGGNGVWKVELGGHDGEVIVDHAMQWAGTPRTMHLEELFDRTAPYFEGAGRLVDQPFLPRLDEGLVRAYLVHEEVVGFTHQHPRGLLPDRTEEQRTAPLVRAPMEDFSAPGHQALRRKVESEWVPQMKDVLGLEAISLPVIWDADFLFGPKSESGEDTYVLCEINVSAVWPFPDQACRALAAATVARIRSASGGRR